MFQPKSLQKLIFKQAPTDVLLDALFLAQPGVFKTKLMRNLWERSISLLRVNRLLVRIVSLRTRFYWPVDTLVIKLTYDLYLGPEEVQYLLCRMGTQAVRPRFVKIYGSWTGYFRGYRLCKTSSITFKRIMYNTYIDERLYMAPVVTVD